MASFLCRSLASKNISEWYGRKLLSFLKLLLLGLEEKGDYFPLQEMEESIAEFTLKYGSESIMEQAQGLFKHI
jgi:hypothetical protein